MSGLATGRDGRAPRIAFFGHFGSLNSGNESTLISILARLREAHPDSKFLCVCTDPEAVAARDGIDAVRITTASSPQANGTRAGRLLDRFNDELSQSVRAFRLLRGTDALIVPGTGLLTDAFGLGAWGPANLFRWVAMARLRGARVAFVSVGAGPLTSTRGQLLVRAALSLADYRSYRDAASRSWLTGIGFPAAGDPIYPDLVFDLPATLLPPSRADTDGRRTVGLGLMLYPGRYSATAPDPATHDRYLEALVELVAWVIEHGYAIRLLFGDGDGDPGVVAEFRALLDERVGAAANEHVLERPLASVKDVITELAATDVVVATRFHNVLLALLLGRPVLAISFHHKCSSLMQRMQLSEYCHEIHEIDATKLIAQFQALERDSASVRQRIEAGVQEARAALAEQYERLLAENGPTGGRLTRHLRRALHGDVEGELLSLAERGWRRLPEPARERGPLRAGGDRIHARVRRRAEREMYLGTLFLRNRPGLELMRRLIQDRDAEAPLRITVLGCSIGVEVYSILWTLRSSRPDLEIVVNALDISAEAVRVGERGSYDAEAANVAGWPIFAGLSEDERAAIFDWDGDAGRVKPWLREGIRWQVGDAADPDLSEQLGPQDLVVANNFLCHMEPVAAERCLRNLAGLVAPDGYLFAAGVDLDVRTRVARELGWAPVADLRAEVHDGDALVRADWPWRWWGLEPFDRRRPDWETRYSAAFRIPEARVPVKL